MFRTVISFVSALVLMGFSAAPLLAEGGLPRSGRPSDAKVYLIVPEDGQRLRSPVVVRFGLTGMGVAPAGVDKARTGHHHPS